MSSARRTGCGIHHRTETLRTGRHASRRAHGGRPHPPRHPRYPPRAHSIRQRNAPSTAQCTVAAGTMGGTRRGATQPLRKRERISITNGSDVGGRPHIPRWTRLHRPAPDWTTSNCRPLARRGRRRIGLRQRRPAPAILSARFAAPIVAPSIARSGRTARTARQSASAPTFALSLTHFSISERS